MVNLLVVPIRIASLTKSTGETVIFVAAEYIEERFHGAFTTGKHLADINSEVPGEKS